ncbi:MAG: hypothetical protein Q7K98_00465 [Candidatus Omnitrophota bacterium]|nr:hypothetical protein [Candidatus Omnitrophota bacterium]
MKTLEVRLPFKLKNTVLALGGQAKNTICFARGDGAYLSPLHADLSRPKDLAAFEKDAKHFLKKHPKIIACDLHPEYQSTKFSESLPVKYYILHVQHHHAHIASCMAENGLENQKIIGLAFDGTGLGTDNTIWGAEVLLCDYQKFSRLAHLKEIPLVGGERAIFEPWRTLAAWLNFDQSVDKKQILNKIYKSGINSPLASSMGRLFDAAGSLVLGKRKAAFEAELAIELEKLAEASTAGDTFQQIVNARRKVSPAVIRKDKGGYILDPTNILKQIIKDLKLKISREKIAWRFHQGVAEMMVKIALILRKEHRTNKIALSGGVFQNKVLLKMSSGLLNKEGFQVFTHQYLPCNDAGISLGQAVIAGYGG